MATHAADDDGFQKLNQNPDRLFAEATNCIQVPSLQEELEASKDRKPAEVYLDRLRHFSSLNLSKHRMIIRDLSFEQLTKSCEDPLSSKNLPSLRRQTSNNELKEELDLVSSVPLKADPAVFELPNEIPLEVEVGAFRFFKNALFLQGRQLIIAKTWQEVTLTGVDQTSSFVKTLQVFDFENKLRDEIAVEQIPGKFEQFRFFDVSIAQNGHLLYFFKRLKQKEGSLLQLYRYDLREFKEEKVAGYSFQETKEVYYQVIFSQAFGPAPAETASEKEFLAQQHIVLQPYMRGFEFQEPTISSLANCKAEVPQAAKEKVEQLHHLFHIVEGDIIRFLLVTTAKTLEIEYEKKTKSSKALKKYSNMTTFHRVWNPEVQVQALDLKILDDLDQESSRRQYFFLNSKNKIQILFPNYEQKVEKARIIEQIADLIAVQQADPEKTKKITYLRDDALQERFPVNNSDTKEANILQEIPHLRMILDWPGLGSEHVLTLCSDTQESILYITEAKSQFIQWIYLKDSHCEECLPSPQQAVMSEVAQGLKKIFIDFKAQRKGRRQLSRKLSKINLLQEKVQNHIAEMCQDKERLALSVSFDASPSTEESSLLQLGGAINLSEAEDFSKLVGIPGEGSEKIFIRPWGDEQKAMSLLVVTRTLSHYAFLFSVLLDPESDSGKVYFFIKKTHQEVTSLSTNHEPLVSPTTEVLLLQSSTKLTKAKVSDLKSMEVKDLQLTTFAVNHESQPLNFIPFIYQEYKTQALNQLLVFDILSGQLKSHTPLTWPKEMSRFAFEDDLGYNAFFFAQASDVVESPIEAARLFRRFPNGYQAQTLKLCVFTLFNEKLGLITASDYLLEYSAKGYSVTLFGSKLLLLSKKCIQTSAWSFLKQSRAVPFFNSFGEIKGCQLFLKSSKKNFFMLNLLDQEENNLYQYESAVCQAGYKKFLINLLGCLSEDSSMNPSEPLQFIYTVSVALREDLVSKQVFEPSEVYSILRRVQEALLQNKLPEFKYFLLNDFQTLKRKDFFRTHQALLGLSFCDVSLSDPLAISQAIKLSKEDIGSTKDSIAFDLTIGDQVRREAFKEIGLLRSNLILSQDLNLVSTLERGIQAGAIKSVKLLLKQILTKINTFAYARFIMADLPCILSSKKLSVNEFITRSTLEKRSQGSVEGFCNMEVPFDNFEEQLPVFSDRNVETFRRASFENHHLFREELVDQIATRDRRKLTEKNIEVEHSFVDYQALIVSEKLRQKESYLAGKLSFDDLYYAKMFSQNLSNLDLFQRETIQKLINFQYETTRRVLIGLFALYLLCYVVPFIALRFVSDEVYWYLVRLCGITQIGFFFIELIQLQEQGLSYFMGWNLVDFSQFCLFVTYYKYKSEFEDKELFLSQMEFGLIVLAFIKILFFIRIFEDYSFLVQMILLTIIDLIPFTASFVLALMFFALCFQVLQTEVDEDISEVTGPFFNQFGLFVLQSYRITIGEIGVPQYTGLSQRADDWYAQINILLIWMVWYANTFFMIIILLNFLIAVISQTYERVRKQQRVFRYIHKAELNEESYQLLSFFTKLPEYKVIVFTFNKDSDAVASEQEEAHWAQFLADVTVAIKSENAELRDRQDQLSSRLEQMEEKIQFIQASQCSMLRSIEAKVDQLGAKGRV